MTSVVDLTISAQAKARARKRTSFLFLWLAVFCLAACSQKLPEHVQLSGATMGTRYHITLVDPVADAEALQTKVDALLVDVNQQMSTYIPDSELMLLNKAPLTQVVTLSPPLAQILAESAEIHAQSGGAFDVTLGPLVNRWGFGPSDEQSIPTADEIAALKVRVGFDALAFSEGGSRVSRQRDVFVDLSAIAKGYGVDKIAELLWQSGYRNYLVEIGGELRLAGHNPSGQPWRIAIERPELAPGSMQAAISITDKAIATSGSYRNFKMVDGKRLSHMLDPQTGRPVTHNLVSVTVIADTCSQADGWATAFSVMGPEAALAYAEAANMPVFMLEEQGGDVVEHWSSHFAPYLATAGDR